jgi:hypothetical protein
LRRRPKVEIRHSPARVRPGDRLKISVAIDSREPTPVKKITLAYRCVELSQDQGADAESFTLWNDSDAWKPSLLVGRSEHASEFLLPADLPPSYTGGMIDIFHKLELHIDIPWWPDFRGTFFLPVIPAPAARTTVPRIFQLPRSTNDRQILIEAVLQREQVAPGGRLEGQFSLLNIGDREVSMAVIGTEESQISARDTRILEMPRTVVTNEGQAVPFALLLPENIPYSFQAPHSSLHWSLEIRAKIGWLETARLRVPFEVVAAGELPANPAATAVGHERRHQMWKALADRLPLTYEPSLGRLSRSFASLTLEMGLEPDRKLGHRLVATLRWPSLGLDLFKNPKDERGEEPDQVAHLLDKETRDILQSFSDFELADEGGRLRSSTAGDTPEALFKFAEAALTLAWALDVRISNLPVRSALRPWAKRWRDFTARLSGRFEPGRVRIYDGRVGGDRVAIETVWRKREVSGTRLRLHLQPPLSATPSLDDAPPLARSLWRQLKGDCQEFAVADDEITLHLAQAALDPASLEPLLDRAGRLALSLRGIGESGPYR